MLQHIRGGVLHPQRKQGTLTFMENKKNYTNITVKTLDNGEVEIRGEITTDAVGEYRTKALKKLGADISIDGFRKGHIPEDVLIKHLGEPVILQEVAEVALQDAYPQIVMEHTVNVLGKPEVTITKLAPDNPIEFKIQTAVVPEISLPDYKKIAQDVFAKANDTKVEVTDDDVEKIVTQIRKNKWHIDNKGDADVDKKEPKDDELPPLTDEVVKQLGDFADVTDFREKLKVNILQDKKNQEHSKRRGEIGEAVVAGAKVILPSVLVEHELEKMLSQFKHDVAGMGIPFEDYLEKIKKTEDDLKKEWKTDAEKRATLQLALNKIAKDENVTVAPEDVAREVEKILKEHPKANKENVYVYVTTLLTNEKTFTFLEEQK